MTRLVVLSLAMLCLALLPIAALSAYSAHLPATEPATTTRRGDAETVREEHHVGMDGSYSNDLQPFAGGGERYFTIDWRQGEGNGQPILSGTVQST